MTLTKECIVAQQTDVVCRCNQISAASPQHIQIVYPKLLSEYSAW